MNHSFRAVALPKEHGAWGYVLEPFVLVLLIAFTKAGLLLLLAAFLFFLAHRPVSLVARARNNSEWIPMAFWAMVVYIASGLAILIYIFPVLSSGAVILYGTGLLIMLGYLVFDIYKKKRSLLAEQFVSVALAFMALAGPAQAGWSNQQLAALFFLLLTRPMPTTFYIYTRLRIEKGLEYSKKMVYFSQVLALIYVMLAAGLGLIPFSPLLAVLILFRRAVKGISTKRKRVSVKKIGMMEFGYGVVFVVITATGYLFGL